ncbi:MAG: VOC family protein [Rhodococcus sp. (in: high G+C Gram-positive bacteria)]|uniref:VOC family protein n=1 Tax=Rhodococcus sp. TaxID=1831 RepID=UPI003BAFBA1D
MTGRIVHFEIPYDDGDRARSFYRDAFGWSLAEIPDMDYTMAITGPVTESGVSAEPGFINGGMTKRGEITSPVVTVDVENIDAALEKIESLGGKTVTARTPIGDMGFAAYFSDSEGNLIGLWETAH